VQSTGDAAAQALQERDPRLPQLNRLSDLRHKNLIRTHHRLSTGTPDLAAGGAPNPPKGI